METLFYILVIFACISCILNTIILFFLSITIINLRDKLREFFSDLVQMIGVSSEPIELPKMDRKTWDEKWEEELIERERLRRLEINRQNPIV